ncbi:head-tail adaptor protein [Mesorhizobium sp. CAU 1732]|uniref:head-tail adaptor protein n=1 Tax=Mesorhizobium sp. CAU 1732 TaxID=3140358 RepID=UPI0032614FDF
MGAGSLREKFTILRAALTDDGYGGETETWTDLLTTAAQILYSRGGETVMAARLEAQQPAILTIRTSTVARSILPTDKAVNARTGEVFNIREHPRESRDNRGYLEMLVQSGVPQ